MKKTLTQSTKKPNSIGRLPSTALKTDDNHDTKKKQAELPTKSNSQITVKKPTPQLSQPVSSRAERITKSDTIKQRVITNTKPSSTQLKKQAPTKVDKSSTKNVQQPKKPLPGAFNVTVNSPPSTRKPIAEISKVSTPRDRTRTRTLKPEEVTVLKQIPHISSEVVKEKPKTPISFNINFDSSKPSSSSSANTQIVNHAAAIENDDEDQYESEFESYESDFESGSSKKSFSSSQSSSPSKSSSSTNSESSSSSDEEHGKSQTNIEQKLDSGNYDMKVKRLLTINENGNSAINEPKLEDNQPDSGMNSGLFENHSGSNSIKILQKRYADILEKISFNTMVFELYEDQPAPYEYFVKNYGKPRDVQNFTQTETDTHSSETQTDNIHFKSAWVQHPPQFSLSCLENMTVDPERFLKEKLGVSQEIFHYENSPAQQNEKLSNFLEILESGKVHKIGKTQLTCTPNFKLAGLRSFLDRSLHSVESVLVRNAENGDKPGTKIMDLNMQTTPFKSTVTSAHYDSKSRHVLLTLHECDVEKSLHRYVISVWNTRICIQPKVILSCWSNVICTELIGPIVLGGTTDGTLCLWDMENNNEELAAPLQLIACNQPNDDAGNIHYGSIVAIRSSNQSSTGCNNLVTYQVITLFEEGMLITWSISRAVHELNSDNNCDLITIFHHAKFQLIQQSIINLRSMVHRAILPSSIPASRGDSFHKGSLEDLLDSKNNTNDEGRRLELWSNSDIQISHNKAFVLLDRQIFVINYLEQKCTLVVKNQEQILCLKEHPDAKGFMLTISSDNLIKVLGIQKSIRTSSSLSASTGRSAKQHCTQSTIKHSPVLNNKSCAIQNIVKNERKLYQETSSHADGLSRPLNIHFNENLHISQHSDQRTSDQVALYHNQLFFMRQLDQRNPWLHFLSQGRILCIGLESNARFIDLKNGQESYLCDYIGTVDAGKRRLLGTTDKQMIMTTDRQGIYLHDISSSFKSS